MKKLFSKRHYEWLTHFAGANLSVSAARHLAEALVGTNDRYDMQKFLETYRRVRNFVKAHDRMHEAASQIAPHHTQQEYNEAAAAVVDEALSQQHVGVTLPYILPWREDGGVMVPVDKLFEGATAGTAEAFDEYLRRHYDEAKAAGTDEIFYTHRCWKCDSGKKPCITGNPSGCRYLYAVND